MRVERSTAGRVRPKQQPRRVAPHPTLMERLRASALEESANLDPALRTKRFIRLERTAPGLNDGLIVPGSYFPVGTPLEAVRSVALRRAPLRGEVRVIVVLVEFPGKPMGRTPADVEELFFSENSLATGSVREFYTEVSGGAVTIGGEVVGPYTMSQPITHYANNDSGTGSALPNARTLAREAAIAADVDVNYGPYDNDGDGFVDAFVMVHAGPGAEVTGNPDDIWSHKWVLSGNELPVDGTRIYAYLTVPEDSRVGVCAHEIGHLLFGWPDLYDIDGSSSGLGDWCLMAGGSWNANGDRPAHPSAWCKATQGWVSVVTQSPGPGQVFDEVKTSRSVHRIWTNGQPSSSEYFLAEHRGRFGFDDNLPGDGLLVYHVDDAASDNTDETHYMVGLVQADNLQQLEHAQNRGDAGDSFPGSSMNTELSDTSSPNTKSYAGVSTCIAMTNIQPLPAGTQADLELSCAPISGTDMRRGATGAEVERLQRALAGVPMFNGPVDGTFGPTPEAAVRGFQHARGLVIDGIVGAQTWAALEGELP
jgi:immune inhibitor A